VRFWWLFALLACDSHHPAACPGICEHDSNVDTFFGVYCDPVAQTGCGAGKKCTWITPPQTGDAPASVRCLPEGSAGLGSACTFSEDFGYDDCARGLFCGNGTCDAICAYTPSGACGSGAACVRGPSLTDGYLAGEGYCLPTCDPLADNDFDGAGSAFTRSGSNCSAPNQGCYGFPGRGTPPPTAFTCADALDPVLHHRDECTGDCKPFGLPIASGCAPGYEPLLRESNAVSTVICVALCAPLDCYAGNCGSNDANRVGAAPHRCASSDAVGSFGSGEECQYLWHLELDGSNHWVPSPYSNSVGICVDRDLYGQPRCNTLPLAAAAAQGCVSTATAGIQP